MSKLIEFFSSFDKLMKEKLVKAFYWLVLINIVLVFLGILFDSIGLDWLEGIMSFFEFFVSFVTIIVGLRLACELAIALFRINDNLSPDGGKSETADIDPLEEARRAAQLAAKRATNVTKTTFERTSAATKSTLDKAGDATKSTLDKTPFGHHDDVDVPEPGPNPARTPKKATPSKPLKTAPISKTVAKKTTRVKRKTTAVKAAPKKKAPTRKTSSSGIRYNKDGTVKKKPGPKPGSSSKYTKDGRLKKKPGPKPKT